ncbi:hypothetical protein GE09DRAFT_1218946 [Coniochaeta sp. 2T2.1]|nr:hypothetical protein GE09DRAFT_1218946 [Coniochaeta sp. 2T2.1]
MLFLEPFKVPSESGFLRQPNKRVKVIVAGLPRTSTASLKEALETLGIGPCHHLGDPPNQYGRLRLTADLMTTSYAPERRMRLAELFEGCEAILEQPVSTCLPDLLEMYPDAKVILTERSSARLWVESWEDSIAYTRWWSWRYVGYLMPGVKSTSDIYRSWTRISAERFGIPDEVTEELYHAHNAWVKRIVPAERLLVYRAQMGFAPLCNFLGREIPDGGNSLPHSHKTDRWTFQLFHKLAMTCAVISWVIIAWAAWSLWLLLSEREQFSNVVGFFFFFYLLRAMDWLVKGGPEVLSMGLK